MQYATPFQQMLPVSMYTYAPQHIQQYTTMPNMATGMTANGMTATGIPMVQYSAPVSGAEYSVAAATAAAASATPVQPMLYTVYQ